MNEMEGLPRFVRAAQKLADQRGTSAEEILLQDERGVLLSGYPTPECLLPHEVEAHFASAAHAQERLSHVESCASCSAVLRAAAGNEDELARIKDALRGAAAKPAVRPVPAASPGISMAQTGFAVAGLALTAWGVGRWLGRGRPHTSAKPADAGQERPAATTG